MNSPEPIKEILFRKGGLLSWGFEIMTLRELFHRPIPRDHDPEQPHRLMFYALLYIAKGNGHHFVDFKDYPFEDGAVITIAKGQVHSFKRNLDNEGFILLFTEAFLDKSLLTSGLMQQFSIYNYQLTKSPVIHLPAEQNGYFFSFINNIYDEFLINDFATEEIVRSQLKILLLRLERYRQSYDRLEVRPEFLNFQALLNEHLFASRKVSFYAQRLYMTPRKLNEITHEAVQLPAKKYINTTFVMEIKRLLANTNLSIKEIAYRTGFAEPTNFVKFFRKHADQTPAHFRKKP